MRRTVAEPEQRTRARVVRVLMGWSVAVTGVVIAVDRFVASDATADECVLSDILVNPCRPMLGANAGNHPDVAANSLAQLEAHEQRIGRPVDVVHLYHAPGTRPLDLTDRYFANRANTILSVTWKPAELWADAGGSNEAVNAEIDAAADDLLSLGTTKVMLTLHHEPENDVTGGAEGCTFYSGDYGTPAEYRAMWRNVHDRFDAKGVTNVVWVMNYMGFVEWDCMVDDLWPGNELVDWVMWDPYSETVPWADTVSRFYGYLEANSSPERDYLSKPWGLGEWSVWRNATRTFTYQYLADARASVASGAFPRLKLYSVFDNAVATPRTSRIGYDSKGLFDQTEIDFYAAFANDPSMTGAWSFMPIVIDTEPPTVPSGLELTGVTPTQVWLRWQASTDDVAVDRYEVLRDGAVVADDVADVVYVDTTASPGTSYTYEVRAVDAAGNASATGDPLVVDTPVPAPDTEPPTAPQGLTAAQTMYDAVHLAWLPAIDDVGVAHYEVLRDGAVVATDVVGEAHIDGAVQPDTDFVFQVRAVDAAGNVGAPSDELAVRTPSPPDTTPPSAPSELVTVDVSSHSVRLQWLAATDEVGVDRYEVRRDGTTIAVVTDTTFDDTAVLPGRAYVYDVRAVDAAGNAGPLTDPLPVSTPDTQPPSAPTALTTTATTLTNVAFTWQAATDDVGVVSYRVSRGTTVLGTVTGTTFDDATVRPSTTYAYTVEALDAAGNVGPRSDALSVRTPDPPDTTPPSAPTSLRTTSSTVTTLALAWNASTDNVGVVSYRVYRGTTLLATVAGTTYTVSGLSPNTLYSFTVRALDAATNVSAASSSLSARTASDTAAPSVPVSLRTTASSVTSVALAWNASTDNVGVVSYRVYRGTTLVATVSGTSYSVTGLSPNTSYSFTVRALDAAGNVSAASSTLSVRTPTDTQAPTTPTGLTGTAGTRSASLRWNAASDNVRVASYRVYRGTTLIATVTGTTYTATGLTSNVTYSFTVRALDAAGNVSAASSAVSVRAR